MKRKYSSILVLLVATVALAAGWPVNAYYDSSAEGVNTGNIMNSGYGSILKVGKVYKFEFKGGTEAYFYRASSTGTAQWVQVSEEQYAANPGEEYDPEGSTSSGGSTGGGGDGGGGGGEGSGGGGEGGGWYGGDPGTGPGGYCGPGTDYDCVAS